MLLRRILPLLLGLTITLNVYAWSAPAHLIIAQIAYDNLEPKAKKQVLMLTSVFDRNYGQRGRFESSATWADQIILRDITAFSDWHYINLPFSPDNSILPTVKRPNIIWAIYEAEKVLKSDKPTAFEKAFFLRFIIHFVGDIHQPLHCATRVTKAHPLGDEGGNLFYLKTPDDEKLHTYWDKALGLFEQYYTSDAKGKRRLVQDTARILQKAYPKTAFVRLLEPSSPEAWANESFLIAKDFVYTVPEHTKPSQEYINKGREIAKQRITLAGYRLAAMLNSFFAATGSYSTHE